MDSATSGTASPAPVSAARGIGAALLALVVTAFEAGLLALALGGIPALAAHPRALALVLVWAASGVVLAVARPVRAQDPVATDRESPLLMLGLLLFPLATSPVSALGERLGVWPWFAHPAVEWAGVAAAAAGLAVRIAAMTRMGSRFSPRVMMQREHRLETGGVYAYVRHPGYSGALLACAGSMLAFGSALALPLVLAFAALIRARVVREERLLESHFGEEYRHYRRRTGGLLPRLAPAPRQR